MWKILASHSHQSSADRIPRISDSMIGSTPSRTDKPNIRPSNKNLISRAENAKGIQAPVFTYICPQVDQEIINFGR